MTTRTITIDGVLTGVWASERLAVLLRSLGQRRAIHLRANRSSAAYTMCIIGPLNSADEILRLKDIVELEKADITAWGYQYLDIMVPLSIIGGE